MLMRCLSSAISAVNHSIGHSQIHQISLLPRLQQALPWPGLPNYRPTTLRPPFTKPALRQLSFFSAEWLARLEPPPARHLLGMPDSDQAIDLTFVSVAVHHDL